MKITPISFKEIKKVSKEAFHSALNDDLRTLQQICAYGAKLKNENTILGEMFMNDFAYEWNTLQAKHFLKDGVLLSTEKSIQINPSIWIITWLDRAFKGVNTLKIDTTFDIRKYPFEDAKFAIDKLKMIYENIFDKELGGTLALSLSKDLLSSRYRNGCEKEEVEKMFVKFIYCLATIEYFEKNIPEDELKDIWTDIIKFYYSEHSKQMKDFFINCAYGKNKKTEMENLTTVKEKNLAMRDYDYSYWKYFISINNQGAFQSALGDEIDLQDYNVPIPSITDRYYKINSHEVLQKELASKENNVKLIKKVIKI